MSKTVWTAEKGWHDGAECKVSSVAALNARTDLQFISDSQIPHRSGLTSGPRGTDSITTLTLCARKTANTKRFGAWPVSCRTCRIWSLDWSKRFHVEHIEVSRYNDMNFGIRLVKAKESNLYML